MPQQDNNNLIDFIATTVETMRAQMATRSDIETLESSLQTLESSLQTLESSLNAKTTAIRGDIERVQVRLDSIDRALSTRMGFIETELSRLRSVVYLLAKDKPEMLRLLGQSTPDESRA